MDNPSKNEGGLLAKVKNMFAYLGYLIRKYRRGISYFALFAMMGYLFKRKFCDRLMADSDAISSIQNKDFNKVFLLLSI